MSLLVKSIPIVTNGDGEDQTTTRLGGCVIRLIRLELGTLVTPDIDISEQPIDKSLLSVDGVSADAEWVPTVEGSDAEGAAVSGSTLPLPVIDRIQIDVASGGANKTGRLILLYER